MRNLLLVGLALLPGLAAADEVYVRGGGTLTGEVVHQGPDSILVDIGTGQIGLPLSSVERIVPGATPTTQYRERASRLAPDDTEGWLELGEWAREQGLHDQARQAFESVLAADPGHAAAHRALGHVPADDRWMTREDSLRARGYVRFEGEWITADERRTILEERRASEERVGRAETEARIREAEARAREADARARLAEVDVARAEVDLRRAEDEARASWPGLSSRELVGWYPGGFYGSAVYAGAFASPYAAPVQPYPIFPRGGFSHRGPHGGPGTPKRRAALIAAQRPQTAPSMVGQPLPHP
jgi:hypothetical protein